MLEPGVLSSLALASIGLAQGFVLASLFWLGHADMPRPIDNSSATKSLAALSAQQSPRSVARFIFARSE